MQKKQSESFLIAKKKKTDIDLEIACLIFSNSCQLQSPVPISVKNFTWKDIISDDGDFDLESASFNLEKLKNSICFYYATKLAFTIGEDTDKAYAKESADLLLEYEIKLHN